MPISVIYRRKSNELQNLLRQNQVATVQFGRDLLALIRNGWGNENKSLRPFPLGDLINKNNGFFERDPQAYETFAANVMLLLNDRMTLNNFLVYFRDNVSLPQQNLLPPNGQFSSDANGWYAATFFLMLYRPQKYLVNLRSPRNQAVNHPLVMMGIIDNNTLNAMTHFDGQNYDTQNYLEIINNIQAYKTQNNIHGDFIDFFNVIENHSDQTSSDEIIKMSSNMILYGPPGTGKTFKTIDKSVEMIALDIFQKNINDRESLKYFFNELVEAKRIYFVTFHQSYSYEEFVEGICAKTDDTGQISYHVEAGIFKKICSNAEKDPDQNYILIIDEINRGNISKIFGELITLIEDSKRQGQSEELTVTLPYSNEPFSVPENLYIIGTMNTADRSLALMDTALRRRFEFIEMMPKPELLKDVLVENVNIKEMLQTMNQRIEVLYDREHTLGHAFFMSLNSNSKIDDLAQIFKNKIIPLLQEYFFEDWEKIRMVFGDDKDNKSAKFIESKIFPTDLFQNGDILKKSPRYQICEESVFLNPQAYIGIYS